MAFVLDLKGGATQTQSLRTPCEADALRLKGNQRGLRLSRRGIPRITNAWYAQRAADGGLVPGPKHRCARSNPEARRNASSLRVPLVINLHAPCRSNGYGSSAQIQQDRQYRTAELLRVRVTTGSARHDGRLFAQMRPSSTP